MMKIIILLIFVVGLLLIAAALRFPKSFEKSEQLRKLFRRKARRDEKESIFKR